MTVPVHARAGVLVVAAAGYGKTTVLEALAAESGQAQVMPADRLLAEFDRPGAPDPAASDALLIDDLDRLSEADQHRLLVALGRLPASVHLALASRRPLNRSALAALRRPVRERHATDLALSVEAATRVLRDEHGIQDADQAEAIHQLTAGWPALVHWAGDALGRSGTALSGLAEVLTDPAGATSSWLHQQVIPDLTPAMRTILELAEDVGPLSAELLRHLDVALPDVPAQSAQSAQSARSARSAHQPGEGSPVEAALADLAAIGVLAPLPGVRTGGVPELWLPVPVLAAAVRRRGVPPTDAHRLRAAAQWYVAHRLPLWAAVVLVRAGQSDLAVALIAEQGDEMLAAGGATALAALIDDLPDAACDDVRLQLLLGDARRMAGDIEGAARVFGSLVRTVESGRSWTAALAWRVAMVRYMRGAYREALVACDGAADPDVDPDADPAAPADLVMLHTCRASALFALGEAQVSQQVARRGVALAESAGEPRLRAAAYTALALSETGSDRELHLRLARDAAEAAGDVVQLARVLVNQGDHLLAIAEYEAALEVTLRARAAAELGAPPGLLQVATHNVGEALVRVGRYAEAEFAFERTARLGRRVGLARAAIGLRGLGEVRRVLGLPEQARMAYEEAVELSRQMGDMQVLVPALCGLSRVMAEARTPDVVAAARVPADEAVAIAPAEMRPAALVARGWVALAEGDVARARELAAEAVEGARHARVTPALAEALELTGAVAPDPPTARAALAEAAALWQRAGALPAVDRLAVLMGRLPGADAAARVAAREAGRRLLQLGVRSVDGGPVLPVDGTASSLRVRVLGGFEVSAAGRPVPLTAWRSKQARTLVKLLVARRGRPVPRGEICELLWPDDEPQRTAHRLSVLLSVVRSVLDAGKIFPPDQYIRADPAGLSLVREHVVVDAEELLRDAAHAVRLARAGEVARARELLAEVDSAYVGDAFDDEPYEEWADALREETRAAWLRSVRAAAELARRAGDDDQAIAGLVRLLAADPLDESAHRALVGVLVRAGRHGEARRAFDRWSAAMRSIEAPAPSPEVLRSAP